MKDDSYAAYLERLADRHNEQVIVALQSLEDRIARYLDDAPTKKGELFDLEWAINARAELRKELNESYLKQVRSVISDYPAVEKKLLGMLGEYGKFTKLPAPLIKELQRQAFSGFEDIAATALDDLSKSLYQYTLTGKPKADMVKHLRQRINGVYIQSDDKKIKELVETANFGTPEKAAEAVRKLHSIYAADKAGNSLRRYSSTYVQDSIMQFNAQAVVAHGKQAGVTHWKYYGDTINDSRSFCIEHAGKVYTTDEVIALGEGDWKGKAAGDIFITRGGYNCRHHWRPVLKTEAEKAIKKQEDDKPVDNRKEFDIDKVERRSQEHLAIDSWTGGDDSHIKRAYRDGILDNDDRLGEIFSDTQISEVKAINGIFTKYKPNEFNEIYRGMYFEDGDQFYTKIGQLSVGDIIEDAAPASWSKELSVAQEFSGQGEDFLNGVIFKYKGGKGYDIEKLSAYSDEREVLVPPSKLKITNKYEEDGVIIFEVEQ